MRARLIDYLPPGCDHADVHRCGECLGKGGRLTKRGYERCASCEGEGARLYDATAFLRSRAAVTP